MGRPAISMPFGARYGRLVVVERVPPLAKKQARYRCICDCGNYQDADGRHLRGGTTTSCGCLTREKLRTHGKSRTRDYGIWCTMKARCKYPSYPRWEDYGGRGISVCESWEKSFESFMEDMGPRPENGSVERIDNDGNYEPSNCRWGTDLEQANNKRNNIFFEHDGFKLTQAQWARKNGLSTSNIYTRLRLGWELSEALTTPVNTVRHYGIRNKT